MKARSFRAVLGGLLVFALVSPAAALPPGVPSGDPFPVICYYLPYLPGCPKKK